MTNLMSSFQLSMFKSKVFDNIRIVYLNLNIIIPYIQYTYRWFVDRIFVRSTIFDTITDTEFVSDYKSA